MRRPPATRGRPSSFRVSAFDWCMATKHKCVQYMKAKLNLPNQVIAAQMGWSESAVEKMVATLATRR
jgi:hypothetical protein